MRMKPPPAPTKVPKTPTIAPKTASKSRSSTDTSREGSHSDPAETVEDVVKTAADRLLVRWARVRHTVGLSCLGARRPEAMSLNTGSIEVQSNRTTVEQIVAVLHKRS